MPTIPTNIGGSGSGGGLHLRNPADIFANAAARTTAFTAGGTLAGEHVQFAADKSLVIIIGTLAAPTFQSYTGSSGAYDDSLWLNRSDAVRGFKGDKGAQGVWFARIFMNSASVPAAAPTGGSVAADGTVTTPTDWLLASALNAPAAGEETYESISSVNPEQDTFPLIPTWSLPFVTGGGLSQEQVDARAAARYTDAEKTKLAGITDGANVGQTETQVNALIQSALEAAVTGNTETNIIVTYDSGKLNFVAQAGGTLMVTDDIYFGFSTDDTPQGSELTIEAVSGSATLPAHTGSRYQLIARLATEADFTSAVYSDAPNTNQIGAFTKFGSTVVPTGETEVFNVWVSNQNLQNPVDVILTVS